ncbi:putative Fe-S cluster assembly protein SufT [Methylohalobius crimeensis]|uniref:putative Fe-S cluster assembly protein SufT n=1 Tax=Methylohalobius crimeensis TaxID=244365 RepID=UPI0003B3B6D8|nr:putative Fe-S cluster assembly protein SufT [Methylohalobius crimeensis]
MYYGQGESIVLQRDVEAIRVPDGAPVQLHKDELVTIYQALGGSYTILTEDGTMARIRADDADALGKEPPMVTGLKEGTDPETIKHNVWEILKTIYDPEIPVNIADLGLVYHVRVTPMEEGKSRVEIIMTLTAPGCGMGPIIQQDVELAVRNLSGVGQVSVEVVFDPPWSRDMMSEAAKLQLGMM